MSESAKCVEPREERSEVEDAGGAEVRRADTGLRVRSLTAYIHHKAAHKVRNPRTSSVCFSFYLLPFIPPLNFHSVNVNAVCVCVC